MKSFFVSVLIGGALFAQSTTTQTNPDTQNTGQTSSAPTGMTSATQTATGQPQTWTGMLIDANCQAVSSMKPTVRSTTMKSSSSSATTHDDTTSGTTHKEIASSSQRTEHTTSDGTQTTASTSRDEKTRTTESANGTEPESGTRSRTKIESSTQSSTTSTSTGSSSDPYPACHVNSSTSSFAVASNGQVLFLDEASNARIRQQLQTDSAFTGALSSPTSAPMSVVVMGNANGPEITVTTLTKSDK